MIYLDDASTTRLDPQVAAAMAPYMAAPGNPHSQHRHGRLARAGVDLARERVAALIGAAPASIVFTSGATESNNWALIGALTDPAQTRRRLVTIATEHSAVLEPARFLARLGIDLVVLPVGGDGRVDLAEAAGAISPETALVSAMLVNNETGVIQPVAELAALAHAAGALFHTDAAQAFGKVVIDVDALGVDLLSVSGHKIYGPQGIGALYIRAGVQIAPLLHGGGQEPGRSGTVPTALAIGLGAAARNAGDRIGRDAAHAAVLRERALAGLAPVAHRVNGSDDGWSGILNIHLSEADGARLLPAITRTVSLSSGAACASAAARDSHVLAAMGLTSAEARACLRLSWGRFTTADNIEAATAAIVAAARIPARAAA